MSTTLRVFLSCLPRMELLLQQELDALLSPRRWERKHGGVEGRITREELWTLSHDLRIAESIRVRVGRFPAPNFEALAQGLERMPWSAYLPREALPIVEVASSRSALYHDDAVRERVEAFFLARAAGAEGGPAPAPPREGATNEDSRFPLVQLRLVNDLAVVSVDASGAALHRRGLRPSVSRAPLRETYAAACLRVSGLSASMSLADPFCGTGVFLSERAGIEAGFALPRRFGFEGWATHDASAYAAWLALRPAPSMPAGLQLAGGDHSSAAIRAAEANLSVWDAGASLRLEVAEASQFLAGLSPETDVICNPPWGLRMRGASAVGAQMGTWLRSRPKGAPGRVFALVSGHDFLRASGVRWVEALRFRDGGTPVALMRYEGR